MAEQVSTDEQDGSTLGTFTWVELGVPDLDVAQEFLERVFGWTFTPFGEEYRTAMRGGRMVCGLFRSDAPTADGARVYVDVADLETTLGLVVAAGGTVERDRQEIGGDMGWWADFRLPSGLLVGLWSMRPPA